MSGKEQVRCFLLTSAQYSIGATVLSSLSGNKKNWLEPLLLVATQGVSLRVAFHSLTQESTTGNRYWNLDIHLEDLETSGQSVEVDVSVERTVKSSGAKEPATTKTVVENGLVTSVTLPLTSHINVAVEVFLLTPPPGTPILNGLDEQRLQDQLADVVLILGDKEFPAHRAVLAATSPVFLKMFSGDFKESKAVSKRETGSLVCKVEVPDITEEAMNLFLTLMYTGQADDWAGLEATLKDYLLQVELLEIAHYYMVAHIKEACEARLMGMDGPTALGLLKHADNPVISGEVRVRAVQAVLRGWKQLSITPQWRNLQKASPVLADAIRAAQQLYEPQAAVQTS